MPSMSASESALLRLFLLRLFLLRLFLLRLLLLQLLLLLMQMQMPTPFQSQRPKPPKPPPSTTQSFASPCTLPGWCASLTDQRAATSRNKRAQARIPSYRSRPSLLPPGEGARRADEGTSAESAIEPLQSRQQHKPHLERQTHCSSRRTLTPTPLPLERGFWPAYSIKDEELRSPARQPIQNPRHFHPKLTRQKSHRPNPFRQQLPRRRMHKHTP
ncbi:hypothetical protein CFBP8129_32280 [Xanthomonas hortorum pv. gardneri]|uniref:Uncharacterized protein n=1 Tax=Xanthomonas hortorum pv. gardneri TaxID=2754056 RepID=A0A6V7E7L2_9XANT|nr:hypothetical protein CFBP2044_31910 [Xanthomonas hortorum pv. cynarae]CAD0346675.1 hypothetical protein CFBP2044_31910 [Xanthomonas hortorum pv. cynarae]CAD0347016.1 hypothetical protein CFBP8129_32280 [Xanthomonas hortorum pv. gardneri]CAD0347021.1 hypothetical protein CFBP8129_32280 [Xanthomonas hortorum pv. gardneri]